MEIAAADLDAAAAYKLLVGAVVPRPIAWISTLSRQGRTNLAPFSCFTFVSHQPPMVGISIGRRPGGLKDTARNIQDTGEFVVNIADETLLDALHRSAAEYGPEVSEPETLGLALAPSRAVKPPRVAAAPIALECRLHRVVDFGAANQFHVGEVVVFHIADALYAGGKIDARAFRPLARLGGPNYATLGEVITLAPATAPAAAPKPAGAVRWDE